MNDNDKTWDKTLGIRTTGRDDSRSTPFYFPYEPTDYCVLERLANSGYIKKRHLLLDYGCGKGRVSFFLAYQTGCKTIGIEYDERLIDRALRNQKRALSANRTRFVHQNALDFQVPVEANRVFFFNPFSKAILEQVIGHILESYDHSPRDIKLFFYYPSPDYEDFLKDHERLEEIDEIPCFDLFEETNARERILVCRVLKG